jgi:hypothetical protein
MPASFTDTDDDSMIYLDDVKTPATPTNQFINSPTRRNELYCYIYRRYLLSFILASAGIVLSAFGLNVSISESSMLDINTKCFSCYFGFIILYYVVYIGGILFTPLRQYTIELNQTINQYLFYSSTFVRIIVFIVLIVRMVENTPMTITSSSEISVYLPKYFIYMILEFIVNGMNVFLIGNYMGAISLYLM